MEISRRTFTTAVLLTIGSLSFRLPLAIGQESVDSDKLPIEIGLRYLELFPEDAANLAQLKKQLDRWPVGEDLSSYILDVVASEFDSGQTFFYKTWILSKIEGQLCALHALER